MSRANKRKPERLHIVDPGRVAQVVLSPNIGQPPDETDDAILVRRRLGLPDHGLIIRTIIKPGEVDPLGEGLWLFQVGIPIEWDWSTGLEPSGWWSRSLDTDGSELTTRYVLLRLTLPGTSLALERYWPPAVPTGTALRGLDEPHTQEQLLQLWRARTVLGLYERVQRGPKAGTGEKYSTLEGWHAAIRERVLTKRTRLTTDDQTIAGWLEIGTTKLHELLKRPGWTPTSMFDLRRGNF